MTYYSKWVLYIIFHTIFVYEITHCYYSMSDNFWQVVIIVVSMVVFTCYKIIVFEAFSNSLLSSVDAKFLR
jgi:hypothetical protein